MNYDFLIKEHEENEKEFLENFEEEEKILKIEEKTIEEAINDLESMEEIIEPIYHEGEDPLESFYYTDIEEEKKYLREEERIYESTDWSATCFEHGYEGGVSTDDTDLSGYSKSWDCYYIGIDEFDYLEPELPDYDYEPDESSIRNFEEEEIPEDLNFIKDIEKEEKYYEILIKEHEDELTFEIIEPFDDLEISFETFEIEKN